MAVSRELIKLGHEITVITEDRFDPDKTVRKKSFRRKKIKNVQVYYFNFGEESWFKKFRIWYLLLKSRSLFQGSDLIHIHDVFIWYLPLRFYFWNKKVFTTFHGYETVFPPTEKAKFIRKISEKLSFGCIIVGNFIKRWYGTNTQWVTYGGVKKRVREKVAIKTLNSVVKILLIGRLEKDIGIQVYKDTLRRLTERNIKFTFTVCGQGSLGQGLEQYGDVLGFVRDVTLYIKKADIVFASSYLSMLQALQLGTPVFATYTNPLKHDYLRDSPFEKYVTISDSAEDLARKVARFTPNLQKLQEGAKWANSQTWEKVAGQYLELWRK